MNKKAEKLEELKELHVKMLEEENRTDKEKIFNKIKAGELTFAHYKEGKEFCKGKYKLMYIGRALNGWGKISGNTAEEVYENAHSIVANAENKSEKCIRNFGGYINRSAFWQLCKLILKKSGECTDEEFIIANNERDKIFWDDRIVWSNLYKIAPVNGGNPNYGVIKATVEDCIEILKKEIEIVEPKHIVMVTDEWWVTLKDKDGNTKFNKTFEKEFNIKINSTDSFVIGKGRYKNIPIIVTKRPERRRETREKQADEVIKAFEK